MDLPPGRRRDIAYLLTPEGRQTQRLTLTWPAPGRPMYYWKLACVQPDGSYQLIGETYREVTNGRALALAMLSGGLTGFGYNNGLLPTSGYINQRPLGLVLARLGPTGRLGGVQQLTVPEAMHASPADSSAALPKGRAVGFRFQGLSANQTQRINQYQPAGIDLFAGYRPVATTRGGTARYAYGTRHCPRLHYRGVDAETGRYPTRGRARTATVAEAAEGLLPFRYLYLS